MTRPRPLEPRKRIMQKFVQDFLFGLGFGCGFLVAYGLLKLIAYLISSAIRYCDHLNPAADLCEQDEQRRGT